MSADVQDPEFHARVHQGHVDNFRRKIESAESQRTLEQVRGIIDAAAAKEMISENTRRELHDEAMLRSSKIVHTQGR